ncbi:MAG: methyltransferase domain-containing protein [Bacteroidales bacterium]|nr:methyltransferase domain-containing protein [Bacteroidales bacterium]
MQYDPIKRKLGSLFGNTTASRKLFYFMLDVLLLRSWHVRRMLRSLSPLLPADAQVLDAGAGFGQYSWRMARRNKGWNITAIDLKEEQVADCNAFFSAVQLGDRVRFAVGDLTTLRHQQAYNLIISVDVMEHIEQDGLVFRNFYSALKPGGVLIISTPSDKGGSDVHDHDDKSFIDEHVRDGYNREALTQTLLETGFARVDAAYTYGAPGSAAWRLSMKYPVKLLGISGIFWLVLPFYYLLVMPLVLLLNSLDVTGRHTSGTGLIVKAVKE